MASGAVLTDRSAVDITSNHARGTVFAVNHNGPATGLVVPRDAQRVGVPQPVVPNHWMSKSGLEPAQEQEASGPQACVFVLFVDAEFPVLEPAVIAVVRVGESCHRHSFCRQLLRL